MDAFGRIDILVNNAGIVRDRTLVKMDRGRLRRRHRHPPEGGVQLHPPRRGPMKEAGYGRIVNITSSAGLRGNFGQTNYGAAKAGIMGMTFVWALELGRSGHHRQCHRPGRGHPDDGGSRRRGRGSPSLDPAMNAPIVAYLASERAGRRQRAALREDRLRLHLVPAPQADRLDAPDGGWDVESVAEQFDAMLGQHLQPWAWSCRAACARTRPGHEPGAAGPAGSKGDRGRSPPGVGSRNNLTISILLEDTVGRGRPATHSPGRARHPRRPWTRQGVGSGRGLPSPPR